MAKKNKGADFEGHAFYECRECTKACGLGMQLSLDKQIIPEPTSANCKSQCTGYCPASGLPTTWIRTKDQSPRPI